MVTPKAVFKNDAGKLELESIHSCSSKEEVIEHTSFKLKTIDKIFKTTSPTDEEIKILEEIDPNGTRFIEFSK